MCWTNTYPSAGGGVMQGGTVARASLTGEKSWRILWKRRFSWKTHEKKATEEKKKNKCRALLKLREETER